MSPSKGKRNFDTCAVGSDSNVLQSPICCLGYTHRWLMKISFITGLRAAGTSSAPYSSAGKLDSLQKKLNTRSENMRTKWTFLWCRWASGGLNEAIAESSSWVMHAVKLAAIPSACSSAHTFGKWKENTRPTKQVSVSPPLVHFSLEQEYFRR